MQESVAASKHYHGQTFNRANEVRVARAKMRRRVGARLTTIYQLLEEPPLFLSTVPVVKLLTWQPRVGLIKARWVAIQVGIDASTPIGSLSERKRERVIEELRIVLNDVGEA